jgi:hypothetical protein
MTGRARRKIKPGDSFTEGEDVELEDVEADPEGTEPAEESTPADSGGHVQPVHPTDWEGEAPF